MKNLDILVVEHQSNGGVGRLGARFDEIGVKLSIVGPDQNKELPKNLDGYDGLIVLGGSMGPTDDEKAPWLPGTRQLLAEAYENEKPLLGICLGAQLLATTLGGLVKEIPEGPEIGLNSVDFQAGSDDPLFGKIKGEVPVVQWHWLEVAQLPENTTVFASSPACKNQAFRVADFAWGVQFHPEADADAVEDWTGEDQKSLKELGISRDEVVAKAQKEEERLLATWRTLADKFAQIAISQRDSK